MLKSNFNKGIFFYVFGSNILLLSFVFLLCALVSFLYGEREMLFFALLGVGTFLPGFIAAWKNRDFSTRISKKDGRLIVGLMWILIPIVGALPYVFCYRDFSIVDALFESYSGYTTTGASVLRSVSSTSKGVLFYRALTQWIGGLGFALLVIFFVRDFPLGAKNLFNAEFNSIEKEKERPHIKNTVYRILGIYFGFTVLCCVLLALGDMDLFSSVCHSLATISTGGFSVSDGNIGSYGNYSQIVIMVFMFLSGISYFLLFWLVSGRWKKVFRDEQLRMYCLIILVCTAAFTLLFTLRNSLPLPTAIKSSFFYVISTLSTTGFDLKSQTLGALPSAVLLLLMFIGGCSASSSTGLKVIRFVVLLKYIPVAMKRVFHPRAVILVRFNGKGLRDNEVSGIFGFFFLFFAIFLLGIIALTTAGNDFVSSFALSAASLGNLGPIMGSVANGFSYADLGVLSKSVLIVLMLLGRLEIFALLAVFSPSVWKKD